jgi:hypothetical protein
MNPSVRTSRTACSLAPDEAALILARLYCVPPASPASAGFSVGVAIRKPALITISVCAGLVFLSMGLTIAFARVITLTSVWRKLFSGKPEPLSGAPILRRVKTYSAQSGYVYQYFYQGWRGFRATGAAGVEYVFSASADRKSYHPVSVRIGNAVIEEWETEHARALSATERYAVAKLALFQAFDERASPAAMHEEIRVRRADLDSIATTLGL